MSIADFDLELSPEYSGLTCKFFRKIKKEESD